MFRCRNGPIGLEARLKRRTLGRCLGGRRKTVCRHGPTNVLRPASRSGAEDSFGNRDARTDRRRTDGCQPNTVRSLQRISLCRCGLGIFWGNDVFNSIPYPAINWSKPPLPLQRRGIIPLLWRGRGGFLQNDQLGTWLGIFPHFVTVCSIQSHFFALFAEFALKK